MHFTSLLATIHIMEDNTDFQLVQKWAKLHDQINTLIQARKNYRRFHFGNGPRLFEQQVEAWNKTHVTLREAQIEIEKEQARRNYEREIEKIDQSFHEIYLEY